MDTPKLPLRQDEFLIELARILDKDERCAQSQFYEWWDPDTGELHKFTNAFVSKTMQALRKRGMIDYTNRKFKNTVRITDKGRTYLNA